MNDQTPAEPDAPTPHAADPDAATTLTPPDVRVPMYAMECPDCGVPFTLPATVYLRRLEGRGQVYCPAGGHLIELRPDDARARDGVALRALSLVRRLVAARQACQALRDELSRRPVPPAGPVTPEEFKRRVRMLENRVERAEYGRAICRFCGKKISGSPYNVRQHLTRNHADEVAALPPEAFD